MKIKILARGVTLLSLAILFSCSNDKDTCVYQPDLVGIDLNLKIERLDHKLLNINSREDLLAFLKAHPIITNAFLKSDQYPSDAVMADALLKRFQNPHIDTLVMEIDRVFGDLSVLKHELELAFSHLKYYYPEAIIPKIQTIATGFDQDMYVSDTLIIIGLDYYLGEGAKFRPLGMYEYILKRYQPEYIVPSIMLLYGISPEYNNTNISDKTVLADMIAYGKSFYFAKHMLPCVPDSIFIWYSKEEIQGTKENQNIIWTHFIENEILYETSHEIKRKYLQDRPKTYEIGEKAPGRIATWLGWEIVKQYMNKNEDITLPQLMQTSDVQTIFSKSKYRPK